MALGSAQVLTMAPGDASYLVSDDLATRAAAVGWRNHRNWRHIADIQSANVNVRYGATNLE